MQRRAKKGHESQEGNTESGKLEDSLKVSNTCNACKNERGMVCWWLRVGCMYMYMFMRSVVAWDVFMHAGWRTGMQGRIRGKGSRGGVSGVEVGRLG